MRLLDLFSAISYFLYICMVFLRFLALCGLCLFFLLMVFLLVPWNWGIGRQGFLILVEWSFLEVRVYIEFFLIWGGLINDSNIII